MLVSRRTFLKISAVSGTGVALSSLWLPELFAEASLIEGKGRLPIIWFQGQSCAGCSVSLLNTDYPSIDEVLIEVISLDFHPNLMGAAGDVSLGVIERMIAEEKGEYILAVEGSIPLEAEGEYCTVGEKGGKPKSALEWIKEISENSMAVVSIGTCASWGGIPAAPPNPTGAVPVSKVVKDKPLINIPGCPAHPDWIVGTLVNVLKYGIPKLDELNRPVMFFEKLLHENCELRGYCEAGIFAQDYGEEGCLLELGCEGSDAHCDVSIRGWNGGVNWCNRAGGPCTACTEPSYPL